MRSLIICFALILCSDLSAQQSVRADISKSFITYYMQNAFHAWSGNSRDINCTIQLNDKSEIEKVSVNVKVKSFDSKNSSRDAHMLEVTDAKTYPDISFHSTTMVKNAKGYKVKGELSFHGVEKPMEFQVDEGKSGDQRLVSGEFVFLLTDFKVERPTIFLVKTDNEVKVKFQVVF